MVREAGSSRYLSLGWAAGVESTVCRVRDMHGEITRLSSIM